MQYNKYNQEEHVGDNQKITVESSGVEIKKHKNTSKRPRRAKKAK